MKNSIKSIAKSRAGFLIPIRNSNMPRKVDITVPPPFTDDLVAGIKDIKGVIGIKLIKGASLQPAGDVISLEILNRNINELMYLLEEQDLLKKVSFSTSQPLSLISSSASAQIRNDRGETIWEEPLMNMVRESSMSVTSILVMFIAGVLAVTGITTNSLHIVIGAMVIAPGFEPLTRMALGWATRHRDWKSGLKDTLLGYAALLAGSIVTTIVMIGLGEQPLSGEASYLPAGVLVSYWTSIKATTVLISLVAAAAGALIVLANKSVLTAGVMIALALVPGMSITGMALVSGEMDVAMRAFLRFGLDAGAVLIVSLVVILIKKATVHKRDMHA